MIRPFPIALVCVCCLASTTSGTEPVKLRFASVAPEGSAWAHVLQSFGRDVENTTAGALRIKWYFGGVAGGELEMRERLRRGQLDGAAAGGPFCGQLAPSLRVVNALGVFASRDEASELLARIGPRLDEEMHESGFVNLGVAPIGITIVFSREQVRSLADLRRLRFGVWDLEEMWLAELPSLGIHGLPLPLDQAGPAYDARRTDGFLATPATALAFQWSAQAKYYTELPVALLPGCLVVAERAVDPLPLEQQRAVRAAATRFAVHFAQLTREQEDELLGGLFVRQGLTRVPVDARLRADFFAAAASALSKIGPQLAPPEAVRNILLRLAELRTRHEP